MRAIPLLVFTFSVHPDFFFETIGYLPNLIDAHVYKHENEIEHYTHKAHINYKHAFLQLTCVERSWTLRFPLSDGVLSCTSTVYERQTNMPVHRS